MRDPNNRLTRAVFALTLAIAVPTVTVALATTAGAVNCSTANVVTGSNFEIDTNANLAVNGASPCIDWLAGGAGTAMRSSVITHADKPTGSSDDAFGGGTAESAPACAGDECDLPGESVHVLINLPRPVGQFS